MGGQQRYRKPERPPKHDASFWRDGTYSRKPYWWWGAEPPRARAGWKKASTVATNVLLLFGMATHRTGTEWVLACTLGPAAGVYAALGFRRFQEWEHYRSKVRPLAFALEPVLDQPARDARSWLRVPMDYAADKEARVVIDVPDDFTASDQDRKDVQRAVEAKLPEIEAPDFEWSLNGRWPRIEVMHSSPPPELVTWEEIKAHVQAATDDVFVVGIGKKGKVIKVSRTLDSPHLMINCGSGAGKSNLAAFLMLQALIRGGWGFFLDAKLTSHPWVYKDMDAEFDQLPNAAYARRIPVMHDALMWLGKELANRYALTERHVNAKGDMRGHSVGPPIFIVAEEMNLSTPQLKEHWADLRAGDKDLPKRSPALQAFGALAFAGRAVDMHLIAIGQQLTAETLGTSGAQGGAVRSNMGIKMLARYDPNGWKMQAGDIPMPPSPSVPGRVQCLAGGDINETQVPFIIERDDLRGLAAGGTVVPLPPGTPGTGSSPSFPSLPVPGPPQLAQGAGEQGNALGRPTFRPPGTATLRELAAAGFYVSHEAAKQASKRDPDHPGHAGWEGAAKLYEISAVADYKAGKARRVKVKS